MACVIFSIGPDGVLVGSVHHRLAAGSHGRYPHATVRFMPSLEQDDAHGLKEHGFAVTMPDRSRDVQPLVLGSLELV